MIQKLFISLFLILPLSSISQNTEITSSALYTPEIINSTEYAYIFSENGKFGLRSGNNKTILPCNYDRIQTLYDGHYTFFRLENFKNIKPPICLLGIANEYGKLIIQQIYSNILLTNNIFIVTKDSLCGLIDTSGKILVPTIYTNISTYFDNYFNGKKYLEVENLSSENIKYYGIINYQGKEIIPCQYLSICYLNKDNFIVLTPDSIFKIINTSNRFLLQNEFKFISPYRSHIGNFVFRKDSLYGIMDNLTQIIYIPQFKYMADYNGKWLVYDSLKNECFILNTVEKKHEIIKIKPGGIPFFENNILLTDSNGSLKIIHSIALSASSKKHYSDEYSMDSKYGKHLYIMNIKTKKKGIINLKGEIIIDTIFDIIAYNPKSHIYKATIINGLQEIYFDDLGNKTYPLKEYQNYQKLKNEKSIVYRITYNDANKSRQLFGVLDKTGNEIIPLEYDRILNLACNDNLWLVQKENKYGIVKSDNSIAIPIMNENIVEYTTAFAIIINGKYKLYNTNLDLVSSELYNDLKQADNNHFFVKANSGRWQLINNNGINNLHTTFKDLACAEIFTYQKYMYDHPNDPVLYWFLGDNNKYGLLLSNEKIVIEPKFDSIITNFYYERLFNEEMCDFYEFDGFSCSFHLLDSIPTDFAIVMINNKYGLINSKGSFIVDPNYSAIQNIPIPLPFNDYSLISKIDDSKKYTLANNYLCDLLIKRSKATGFPLKYIPTFFNSNKALTVRQNNSNNIPENNYINSQIGNLFSIYSFNSGSEIPVPDKAQTAFYKIENNGSISTLKIYDLFRSNNYDNGLKMEIINELKILCNKNDANRESFFKIFEEMAMDTSIQTLDQILFFLADVRITNFGLTFNSWYGKKASPFNDILIPWSKLKPFISLEGELYQFVK